LFLLPVKALSVINVITAERALNSAGLGGDEVDNAGFLLKRKTLLPR
jgi:hypothetical protein